MKLLGLQGCDKKQRSCCWSDEAWEGLTHRGFWMDEKIKGLREKGFVSA
jgi:hypothetical protein